MNNYWKNKEERNIAIKKIKERRPNNGWGYVFNELLPNSEKLKKKKQQKQWRENNPEKWREINNYNSKKFKRKHPERYKIYIKRWQNNHPEHARFLWKKYRHQRRSKKGTYTKKEWVTLLEKVNGICIGWNSNPHQIGNENLVTDHVFPLNPKKDERPGTNYITNLFPLCASCNNKKGNRQPTKDYLHKIAIFTGKDLTD